MDKKLLDIYSNYLISQGQYATATRLAAVLNGEVSRDQVSRFLRADDYNSKDLWVYIKSDVRRHEQPTGGAQTVKNNVLFDYVLADNWFCFFVDISSHKWLCILPI